MCESSIVVDIRHYDQIELVIFQLAKQLAAQILPNSPLAADELLEAFANVVTPHISDNTWIVTLALAA